MGSHQATLVGLAKKHRWQTGVEVGVDRGWLSRKLLDAVSTLTLIGVENFSLNPQYRHEVEALVLEYPGRFRLLAMDSADAATHVPPASVDFVFLDADHAEAATRADMGRWVGAVKPGGWFGGDAYNPTFYPGVVRAVDQLYPTRTIWPGRVWGVWR